MGVLLLAVALLLLLLLLQSPPRSARATQLESDPTADIPSA